MHSGPRVSLPALVQTRHGVDFRTPELLLQPQLPPPPPSLRGHGALGKSFRREARPRACAFRENPAALVRPRDHVTRGFLKARQTPELSVRTARDPAGCESPALSFCLRNTLVIFSRTRSLTAAQLFAELASVPECGLVQYPVLW